ncbi:hypothetical protein D5086_018950 [Populus alba]|uniref:Major pollen allergen Bet v 1k family protein n=4 Tax=Populus TaxID=3689 RepID=A0A4U5Q8N3_POPAL|nr:major allergen Pru ar 1-like [Populus alba]KAG6758743.1 hypothetical protein POTOM_035200 [Populus tomentosa]KAJ6980754.1 major allergen Pru ar 1-like [Populus alba x Populus x berolinensis]TKS06533.1 major pollen allergen Bet v 1k family protein [Populus alba]
MGVITCEKEIALSIPPAKIFKAFVLDGNHLIPKAVPGVIESLSLLEGDGGPGSIKQVNFGEGTGYKYVKERIDVIDKENCIYEYTMIEGDVLGSEFEKVSNVVKFEASPDGGSICKGSSKYYTIGDIKVNEEEIDAFKEKQMGLFKAIEAYLLANPDA